MQSLTGRDPKTLAPGTIESLHETACENVAMSENELRSHDNDFHHNLAKQRLEIDQCARGALQKLQTDLPAPEPEVFGPPIGDEMLGYGWDDNAIDTDPNRQAAVGSPDRRSVPQRAWQSFLRYMPSGGPGGATVGKFRALKLMPH